MELKVKQDVLEKLIDLHEAYMKSVYPHGHTGTFDFSKDDQMRELSDRHESDPNRIEFFKIVESLDVDSRAEIIALMFLGREANPEPADFHAMLEQAKRIQGNDAEYLFSKAELSRFLKRGIRKVV